MHATLAQFLVMVLILIGGALFIRHKVTTMERADFSKMVYMEDSKAGVVQKASTVQWLDAMHCIMMQPRALVRGGNCTVNTQLLPEE